MTETINETSARPRPSAWKRVRGYVALTKPRIIELLLITTVPVMILAQGGFPDLWLVLATLVGGTLAAGSANAFNMWFDRDIDAVMERTKDRPLAAKQVTETEALVIAGVLTLLAFLLILPLHKLVWLLSVVALFLAASYPLTKRFFFMPQAYLGVAFGFGIPMAFAAQLFTVPPLAWVLLAANICWAIGYDTCYAMVDRDDDLKIGIKTSAITFGRFDVAAVMLSYAATLAILAWVGAQAGRGIWFYLGLAVAGGMMLRHYFWIRGRERMACFRAFKDNNWVGAAIFAGLALDYALSSGRMPAL